MYLFQISEEGDSLGYRLYESNSAGKHAECIRHKGKGKRKKGKGKRKKGKGKRERTI